jgi:hypothetical protein
MPRTPADRAKRAAYMRRYRAGIRVGRGHRPAQDRLLPVTGRCTVCQQPYRTHPIPSPCRTLTWTLP